MAEFTKNQKLIASFINQHEKPTVTGLMKLAYLTDLIAKKRGLSKCFDYTYRRYTYGPFDEAIYHDLKILSDNNITIPSSEFTSDGREYIVYNFNPANDEDISIDEPTSVLISEIVDAMKGYGAKALTEIAYKTAPMQELGAKLGGSEHLNAVLNLDA